MALDDAESGRLQTTLDNSGRVRTTLDNAGRAYLPKSNFFPTLPITSSSSSLGTSGCGYTYILLQILTPRTKLQEYLEVVEKAFPS